MQGAGGLSGLMPPFWGLSGGELLVVTGHFVRLLSFFGAGQSNYSMDSVQHYFLILIY